MSRRTIRPRLPVDLHLTLGPLGHGRGNPSMRFEAGTVWRATRTPQGPVTTHLRVEGPSIVVRAWGPGAEWALEAAPALVGDGDDEDGFVAHHPIVGELRRRLAGLRMPRTSAVVEALVPTILEQKVVGREAKRSYARLVRALSDPAPGPGRLLLPPDPARLAATPYYAFHPFGIERRRADTVRLSCRHARRLEEAAGMTPADARRRLTAVPGVGPWTAAEVARAALGDADAVSEGDYHLPHQVAWALAGEARADDARMLELLEPYRGHRGRVIRLIEASGLGPPRFGPRMPLQNVARL